MSAIERLDCASVRDLAPEYVLGILPLALSQRVRDHLAGCARPHPEFAELGGVLPYLGEAIEPVEPPASLRDGIMAAAAAEPAAVTVTRAPAAGGQAVPPAVALPRRAWWLRSGTVRASALALAAAAVVVIAALGAWNISLRSDLESARREIASLQTALARSQAAVAALRTATSAAAEPGAVVARLVGTEQAPGSSGLVIMAPGSDGILVVKGLLPAPSDRVYELWYIAGKTPRPAGIVQVGADGIGILSGLRTGEPVEVIAITLERAPGTTAPEGKVYAAGPVKPIAS